MNRKYAILASTSKINVRYIIWQIKVDSNYFQCDHMIYIYSIPSQFLQPYKIHYIAKQNINVCVCADLTSLVHILLPNYIIFVHACAEFLFHFSRLYKYYTFLYLFILSTRAANEKDPLSKINICVSIWWLSATAFLQDIFK